ncbi:unnamed protein product [Rotaria sordida]|uniref:AB hydrolase-1 domain-containing protein n=2 Tax=Rotaria sordida TaxID=392033 RepID=A0A814GAC3_9BILA|nr:unnamed protein product [Rotaria sordida]
MHFLSKFLRFSISNVPLISSIRQEHSLNGSEPAYHHAVSGYQIYKYKNEPFRLKYNNKTLNEFQLAYETWGKLNAKKNNAVLIFTGTSSSSHAKSHDENPRVGWWEKIIGPNLAIDTNHFFVICCNHLGGCYGSTGPSSINPATSKPYGASFPMLSVEDFVRAQFQLIKHLGIAKLRASIGSSLGGMCSILSGLLYSENVGRVVTISSCIAPCPTAIALRYLQRKMIMTDPNWTHGHYYDKGVYPLDGMRIAREIGMLIDRSGSEWLERFGLRRFNDSIQLTPTFEIESYLQYHGLTFTKNYDPNSLLYISKAIDLFNLTEGYDTPTDALSKIRCPVLVLGSQTDILFPIWQQKQLTDELIKSGNPDVTFFELNSIFGHDTFLLDINSVSSALKGFLEVSTLSIEEKTQTCCRRSGSSCSAGRCRCFRSCGRGWSCCCGRSCSRGWSCCRGRSCCRRQSRFCGRARYGCQYRYKNIDNDISFRKRFERILETINLH